jgi:hypothetical protein
LWVIAFLGLVDFLFASAYRRSWESKVVLHRPELARLESLGAGWVGLVHYPRLASSECLVAGLFLEVTLGRAVVLKVASLVVVVWELVKG